MSKESKSSLVIAVSAVFAALTAVLTYLSALASHSPTGGYTNVGDTIIFIAGLLFGSRVGLIVGLVGPVIAVFLVGYSRWYVTLVAHGLEGFIVGMGARKSFKVQLMMMIIGGLVMSFTYFVVNVYVEGLAPAVDSLIRDVFGQTLVSIILASLLLKPLEKIAVIKRVQEVILG
ncbi:MAG: ECF transporter S component [Thermofilum sp.]|nr:ECF transporter S component [Thermofilum sp.]